MLRRLEENISVAKIKQQNVSSHYSILSHYTSSLVHRLHFVRVQLLRVMTFDPRKNHKRAEGSLGMRLPH